MNISTVVPVFNEEGSLQQLHEEISAALPAEGRHEILFIDDGSTDGSHDVLRRIAEGDSRVRVVTFYHNYGKAEALAAGFEAATGDTVVTLDADLQDDPAEIPGLVAVLAEGWDLVSGWKKERRDPLSKRLPSRLFNFTVRLATGVPIHDSNCGLKAYRAPVVKNLEVYGGLHRYIPALAKYKGFRVTEKVVRHRPRLHGKTKYGAARYLHGLLDLFTVLFLGRYFQRPLHFFGPVGLSVMGAGLGISIYLTINWFGGIPIGNRPLFFLGILAIIVGIQFLSLGLMAELIVQRGQREQRRVKDEYPPRR